MSTAQLRICRKLGDALYGDVVECELLPPHLLETTLGNQTTVAVKRVLLSCVRAARQSACTRRAMDDPVQECRVNNQIAANGGHRNVVRPYFHFQESDCLYLVNELCAGGDLHAYLVTTTPQGWVDEQASIRIMSQVFAGVGYLHHQLGIAHRDLSLENVLVHEGECKIIDFGLSVSANTRCKGRAGKDYYMAPEVVAGEAEYDPVKADIWSLGIMWFVMLTGSPLVSLASQHNEAFVALARRGVVQVFKAWGFDTKLSPGVIDLIALMLKVDPAERISLEDILSCSWLKIGDTHATRAD